MPLILSKRYKKAQEMLDRKATYALEDAVKLLKTFPPVKFDETVEISASLNIDPKKTDQTVRGTVVLPHGTGKTRRVVVFCKGENAIRARSTGAEEIGDADLIEKIQQGWLEFDVAIATPDMMRDVSRLGRILGPRGLMPNPKTGTVTDDVAKAIQEVKRGRVEFKMDKLANIHFVIGKLSFQAEQLIENSRVAIEAIMHARPSSIKGRYIKRLSLSSTMSPGIALKTEGLEAQFSSAES
ncbi:MAG: 50S ribosomal protein L1 [Candidatus Omnitrophica bacterium]|nr:50S ribosomal protein L1 [Candidatus Omnitrophota bacterium]MBI2174286.1 50S ribosomal protein L1 [Candidatus Omnitrophota bacterium]MBI3010584.1 50S ribosomal protein L1 [Candidatus Omnitrophota bacterium]